MSDGSQASGLLGTDLAAARRRGDGAALELLLDRAEITDLLVRYSATADTQDWAGWEALMTDDVEIVYPFGTHQGRDGVGAWMGPRGERFDFFHHVHANHEIEVDGDVARSKSYFLAHRGNTGVTPVDEVGGRYVAEHRRTADGWRIRRLEAMTLWADVAATPRS